jgi:hypothetical protein
MLSIRERSDSAAMTCIKLTSNIRNTRISVLMTLMWKRLYLMIANAAPAKIGSRNRGEYGTNEESPKKFTRIKTRPINNG